MIIITLFFPVSFGQSVGINNDGSAPNPSALLDVKNPNKGLLIPRVALTGTNDAATIASPATSLLVYNTTAAGSGATAVTPGFYYWNGSAWIIFSTSSSAWSLTGNAGTVDGTSFIGTTDNVPLNIRVNNQKAGRIDASLQNTFWGYLAGNSNNGGMFNTANGYGALKANTTGGGNTATGANALFSNISGSSNTANGNEALYSNISGTDNVANGNSALFYNTSGNNNTANGFEALASNTGGYSNTANGNKALFLNTTGYQNTANGDSALYSNQTGIYNTANGFQALYSNQNGTENTANGFHALFANQIGSANTATGAYALHNNTGINNTALGWDALGANFGGGYNTALGYGAGVNSDNLSNATALGANATVSVSNTVQIGDPNVTNIYFGSTANLNVGGDVLCKGYFQSYFTAVGGYLKLDRNSSNQAIWVSSDKRLKKNITTIHSALSKLDRLNAVTFNWNQTGYNHLTRNITKQWTSKSGTQEDNEKLWAKVKNDEMKKLSIQQYGFVAQDVEKVFPDWVKEEDGYKQIKMDQLMPVVVEAIKELRDQKDAEINKLKAQVAQLKSSLQSQNEIVARRLQQLELLVLHQNTKTDVAKK